MANDFMKKMDAHWKKNAQVRLEFIINNKPVIIQQLGKYFKIKIDGNVHRVYGRDQWKVEFPREYFIVSKDRSVKNLHKIKGNTKDKIVIKHLNESIVIQKIGKMLKIVLGKNHQLWTSFTFSNYFDVKKKERM